MQNSDLVLALKAFNFTDLTDMPCEPRYTARITERDKGCYVRGPNGIFAVTLEGSVLWRSPTAPALPECEEAAMEEIIAREFRDAPLSRVADRDSVWM